jgi:hypothetical protein
MLPYPFLRLQQHKLFPDGVEDMDRIFATFEAEFIAGKIQVLHGAKLLLFFGWMK